MIDSSNADQLMQRDADHLVATARDGDDRLAIYRFAHRSITAGRNAVVEDEAIDRWQEAGHDYARRPTGGGILRHSADDLAFGATFACGSRFAGDFLRRVSEALRISLAAQGIITSLPEPGGTQPLCCFQRAIGDELLLDGEKLIGLAARRVRGAVLIQGALVVRREPELDARLLGFGPAVDLWERAFDPETFAMALSAALKRDR